MGNEKLDPRSLTPEERAIVDAMVNECSAEVEVEDFVAVYQWAFKRILARRAIFGEPASEPAKVECPNCGEEKESNPLGHSYVAELGGEILYYCKPAQPEPSDTDAEHEAAWREFKGKPERVAEEMPDLQDALNDLWNAMGVPRLDVREISVSEAIIRKAIEAVSTHAAQPAKVRMTEEFAAVLDFAADTCGMRPEEGWRESKLKEIRPLIAAVRAQAAEAGKVRMPKVREFLEWAKRMQFTADGENLHDASLAELDASEGKK